MIPSTPLAQQPEPVLVALAQAGDEAAFLALYKQYERPLYAYVRHLTKHHQQAEDITQDALIKAWAALSKTRPGTTFGPWLYRIATNLARDRMRHESLVSLVRWEVAGDARPVGRFEQPDALLELRELRQGVAMTLRALPAHYRQVLFLVDVMEMTYAQTGAVLGRAPNAVKGLVYRAREAFRRRWRRLDSSHRLPEHRAGRPVEGAVRAQVLALKGTVSAGAAAQQFDIGRTTVMMWWKEAG